MLVRLATRGSELALKQAQMTADFLKEKNAELEFEIVVIKTSGDKRQDWSLEKFGGKGLFTKEIEEALLANQADIAVHSAKDLPTDIADGLCLAGCLPREACADVLAVRSDVVVPSLIATGSPRRRSQLKKIFPQAVWTEIRGNVSTRLKKISNGLADATVLSQAGLERLNISEYEGIKFTPLKLDVCVPASGQGFIALECRKEDKGKFAPLTDAKSNENFALEREFLIKLGGGCQTPFGSNCDGKTFRIFHENCGIQRLVFPETASFEDKMKLVAELAEPLK